MKILTNMMVKTKTDRTSRTNRIRKQTKPKVERLNAIENTLLAHQVSEVTRKRASVNLTSPSRQTSRKAVAPESRTIIQANLDVGFGNALFIRGEGNGLSWDKGQPLTCIDPNWWHWSTTSAREKVVFKLLLNDKVWAKGENVEVEPGKTIKVAPEFP